MILTQEQRNKLQAIFPDNPIQNKNPKNCPIFSFDYHLLPDDTTDSTITFIVEVRIIPRLFRSDNYFFELQVYEKQYGIISTIQGGSNVKFWSILEICQETLAVDHQANFDAIMDEIMLFERFCRFNITPDSATLAKKLRTMSELDITRRSRRDWFAWYDQHRTQIKQLLKSLNLASQERIHHDN